MEAWGERDFRAVMFIKTRRQKVKAPVKHGADWHC